MMPHSESGDSTEEDGDDLPPTQEIPTQGGGSSQSKSDRIWKLENAEMRILDFCATDPGKPMTIKMEFTFPNGMKKKVDLPYTPQAMKDSRMHCVNRIGKPVYLDDLKTEHQNKYFPYYIEQMVQAFDRANDPSTNSRKPIFEVKKPSVHKIMDKFYFIAGQAQVFLLSHKRAEGEAFAQKLSPDEINDLQMEPIYVGPVTPEYKTDEKEALELLLKIIAKMNLMQDPEFYSFPLASFAANLACYLYPILVEAQRSFMTSVVLSGDGNTCRTGKSLMTSTMQKIFLGEYQREQHIKLSESTLFNELDIGNPVYLREWAKHAELLNLVVPMIWERLGRKNGGVYQGINTVVMVEANLSPAGVKLTGGNPSKVSFIATGSRALDHEFKLELCKEIILLAGQLNSYLPVIFGLGLCCLLEDITTAELRGYDGVLKEDGDDRQGQTLLNYDRLYSVLQESIIRYELEVPLLFQYLHGIDRRALTFYNGRDEEKTVDPEEFAQKVAEHLLAQDQVSNIMEFSERLNGFKLKLSFSSIPDDIAKSVRLCTRETTSTFAGKAGIKIRVMASDLLPVELVLQLKTLLKEENYEDWVEQSIVETEKIMTDLGNEFYQLLSRPPKRAAPTLEVEDEFDFETERTPEAKTKIANDVLRCTVSGCPSYVTKHVFATLQNYKKHIGTRGHLKALKELK